MRHLLLFFFCLTAMAETQPSFVRFGGEAGSNSYATGDVDFNVGLDETYYLTGGAGYANTTTGGAWTEELGVGGRTPDVAYGSVSLLARQGPGELVGYGGQASGSFNVSGATSIQLGGGFFVYGGIGPPLRQLHGTGGFTHYFSESFAVGLSATLYGYTAARGALNLRGRRQPMPGSFLLGLIQGFPESLVAGRIMVAPTESFDAELLLSISRTALVTEASPGASLYLRYQVIESLAIGAKSTAVRADAATDYWDYAFGGDLEISW